jgi:hypothetical protein
MREERIIKRKEKEKKGAKGKKKSELAKVKGK